MNSPIFIVGPHRSGSTVWHNLVAMCPDILRLTDARFLSRPGQRDFKFFLNTQARDLSADQDVERMVQMSFSKNTIPELEGAFWRFEGTAVAQNPELRKAMSSRMKQSHRSMGHI